MRPAFALLLLALTLSAGCTTAPKTVKTIDRSAKVTRFVDVPVPPGYALHTVVKPDEDIIVYRWTASEDPDPASLVAFFREALPKEGWTSLESNAQRVTAKKKGLTLMVFVTAKVSSELAERLAGVEEPARQDLKADAGKLARRSLSIWRFKH